jgi:hypothetical protein
MPVADPAHEAARRYIDAIPLTDLARELLNRLGVPACAAYLPFVNHLARVLRDVLETALVEFLTIPELAALARSMQRRRARPSCASCSCSAMR